MENMTEAELRLAERIAYNGGERAPEMALHMSYRVEEAGLFRLARTLVKIAMYLLGLQK